MLSDKEKFLLYMSLHDIPNKKQEQLLESLEDFSLEKVLLNRHGVFSDDEAQRLRSDYDTRFVDNVYSHLQAKGIAVLTIFSDDYPQSLIDLPDRPLILYAKGDISLMKEPCFAIVGTRMPTSYGRVVTEKFAKKLAESGLVIVSGLCYGVDAISHRTTLDIGGKTIAIIASGFNNIYPSANADLAREISEKGLLLSEYPPSFTAKKYTFPRRNRIIAGLSKGILITEASFHSGTMHTKEFALEYGRDVFAVPGNINSSKSELTNHLIKTAQAECSLSAEDILSFYSINAKQSAKENVSLSFDEKTICDLLADEAHDFEYLAKKSNLSTNILNSCLTTLEIRGLIKKLPAQTYALIN